MNISAILMFAFGALFLWGGLALAIRRALKDNSENKA